MVSNERPPVIVSLSVEYPGGSETETYEIPRDKWDAMTPEQRTKLCEEAGADHAYEYVGWGWHILDQADYAGTGQS